MQSQDHRLREADTFGSADHSVRNDITAHDATKDIHKNRFYIWIIIKDLKGLDIVEYFRDRTRENNNNNNSVTKNNNNNNQKRANKIPSQQPKTSKQNPRTNPIENTAPELSANEPSALEFRSPRRRHPGNLRGRLHAV